MERMKKRKYKKFGAIILIVVMIVTMFSTVSASADEGGTAEGVITNIFKYDRWYLRSPHSYHAVIGKDESYQYLPALYNLTNAMGNGKSAAVYCVPDADMSAFCFQHAFYHKLHVCYSVKGR